MENFRNEQQLDEQLKNKLEDLAREVEVIPVIQEQVKIDKKVVDTGKVRISKTVKTEEERVEIPVTLDKVNVERVKIEKYIQEAPPAVRYEGEVMIIPVLKEVLVVEKRLMLMEELHISRTRDEHTEQKVVTLLKEEIKVEHEALSGENH